jgi:hypothetical protein
MFVGGLPDASKRTMPRAAWRAARNRSSWLLNGLLLASLFMGCSSSIDWREMQPAGAHLRMAMPCRPISQQRNVPLAGASVEMTLFACHVDAGTFAVSFAEMGDPTRVGPALKSLVDSARANVQGQSISLSPAQVRGMTPQPQAQQWRVSGRMPDGRPVSSQGVVFAHGTRVYQATIVGENIGEEPVRTFLDALVVQP